MRSRSNGRSQANRIVAIEPLHSLALPENGQPRAAAIGRWSFHQQRKYNLQTKARPLFAR
jgi:hypothetical protein